MIKIKEQLTDLRIPVILKNEDKIKSNLIFILRA